MYCHVATHCAPQRTEFLHIQSVQNILHRYKKYRYLCIHYIYISVLTVLLSTFHVLTSQI
jgi:hypothetical protein